MSIPQSAAGAIGSCDDLVAYIVAGAKPCEDWRIGTEHEKFVYALKDCKPLPYEAAPGGTAAQFGNGAVNALGAHSKNGAQSAPGEPSIAALLRGMAKFGWKPIFEGRNIISLAQDNGSLSLEPGGQFELSGAPLKTVHETCAEVTLHRDQMREVCAAIGAGSIGVGFAPTWKLSEMPQMPKGRYDIMRAYMPKVGRYGLEMMFRTCTVQANFDFSDEADMVKKLRVALALQPVATALFANSPFREGKPNGYLSYRGHIWTDVDDARTGLLPFVFEDGFGFERYVDYALDVPMYFIYRDGRYHDVAGKSFRDFMEHRIEGLQDVTPTLSDWADHLTTIFPEARLKQFIEVRGADGGTWRRVCSLPALWTGLLYDGTALDAAWDLVKGWTSEERRSLRASVPMLAFNTPFRQTNVLELARSMLEIATHGLQQRAFTDGYGMSEEVFLQPLQELVDRGQTHAEELLMRYHGEWKGDLSKLFEAYNFL